MSSARTVEQNYPFLATALATRREKLIALAIAAVSLVAFLALVPFVRVPLPPWPAFIPSYETALFFIDLITAALLFEQFARLHLLSILVLASGYLFDALMIVPHALSFPGAFSASGLLGAREQTTAWLYVFWHGGFPLFVIGYALLRGTQEPGSPGTHFPGRLIVLSGIGIALLVTALTLLATWGHDLLPVVMRGSNYSMLVSKGISPAVWGLTLLALIVLWRSRRRIVDLWLMVVMWIWLFDIALAAIVGSNRFDLGFYAGRIFGLIAASFLLITLLVEMARLHAGAIRTAAGLEAKLAQLARAAQRKEPAPMRGETTDLFIQRQNVAHYQSLLDSNSLDQNQRRAIEKLLEEEKAKARGPDSA
jgi:two-component system, sensor histidine kinase and response regulator